MRKASFGGDPLSHRGNPETGAQAIRADLTTASSDELRRRASEGDLNAYAELCRRGYEGRAA